MLPAVTLATILLPNFVLITRTSILELMSEQFVVTGRSKGLSRRRVLFTHVLPNAVNPVLSFLGVQVGTSDGGLDHHRDDLCLAGRRAAADQQHLQSRRAGRVEAAVFFIATAIALANLPSTCCRC